MMRLQVAAVAAAAQFAVVGTAAVEGARTTVEKVVPVQQTPNGPNEPRHRLRLEDDHRSCLSAAVFLAVAAVCTFAAVPRARIFPS